MNFRLFKANIKSNWVLLLIFFGFMLMYLSSVISMFDPEQTEKMAELLSSLPQQLMKAIGFSNVTSDLTTFIGNMYYGFIALLFPMIYCILLGNKLVARLVDNGSMTYLLSTPNSRVKIAVTQAVYALSSLTALIFLLTVSGIGMSHSLFSGMLDVEAFIKLNICLLLLFFAISSICFFFSCLCNESKNSFAWGAGIPAAFFIIKMLANAGEKFSWLKNFTLLTLFNPTEILAPGSSVLMSCIVLLGITIILYVSGILIFSKRDLPL